jgi:UDP-N-acetylmuramoylalanine--D-glutamate ligase
VNVAFKNRIIVGLGKTGLSVARYLHSVGVAFSVMDSRMNPPGLAEFSREFPQVPLTLGEFSAELLRVADELVVSPGISLDTPAIRSAIAAGVAVTGDIDIFSKAVNAPILAVTGSNGKSTVVSLLGAMARAAGINVAIGGNLDGAEAAPALDLLRGEARELYVLELSSFQLETTSMLGARAAVILNISDDHMDRYASVQDYAAAKQRIFRGCQHIVLNRDEVQIALPGADSSSVSSFGLDAPGSDAWGVLTQQGRIFLARGNTAVLAADEMKIAGKHNVANALAALALGEAAGLPVTAMLEALRRFPGLPHRCQWVRVHAGVNYYNDSKGTNVGASIVAIESLGELATGKLVLIAGGIGKEADFSPMLPVIARFLRLAILIGRDAGRIAAVFKHGVQVVLASSMEAAVQLASENAQPGDVVLLSPACASLDMFTDFAHRGRVFTQAVEALS